MSITPKFDASKPASTIYDHGTPYLEQGGELFTFAEYDQRTQEYNSDPVWLPTGQISSEEVTAAINRLSAEFTKISLLMKETMKVLKRNENSIPQCAPEVIVPVEQCYPRPVLGPAPSNHIQALPSDVAEKKTPPVKKSRKPRGPKKKKVTPSIST